jgi:hypothetical protein
LILLKTCSTKLRARKRYGLKLSASFRLLLGDIRPSDTLAFEITDVELAKRLEKHGFKTETEASITNKLARGTFPATFLACLVALELDGVALEEI